MADTAQDSDNESVLSSLPSSPAGDGGDDVVSNVDNDNDAAAAAANVSLDEEDNDDDEEDESDAETEPLPPTSSAARSRGQRAAQPPAARRARQVLPAETSSEDEHVQATASRRNRGARDTLDVPAGTQPALSSPSSRRMSFDDGSDLSALTSEAEDAVDEELEDEEEEDEEAGDEAEDDDDYEEGTSSNVRPSKAQQLANSTSTSASSVSKRNGTTRRTAIATATGAGDSTSMDEEDENGAAGGQAGDENDSLDSGSEAGANGGGKTEGSRRQNYRRGSSYSSNDAKGSGRGRGRPPRRQNALAAAAKRALRNSSKHGKYDEESDEGLSMHDDMEVDTEGDIQAGGRPDSKSARIIVTRAADDEDEGDEEGEQQDVDETTEAPAETDKPTNTKSTSSGSLLSRDALMQNGLLASVNAAAAAGIDTEDAMSGISDDVPILLQATAKAQAQGLAGASSSGLNGTKSAPIVPRLSLSTTAADAFGVGGSLHSPLSRDTHTPEEDDMSAPPTPLLPLPSSGFPGSLAGSAGQNSIGRRRSPAPEGSVPPPSSSGRGGRGRGRGAWGRGRGKKHLQARLLAAGDEDGEVSTSAAEDGQDREGSPGHETGAGSDHEEDTTDVNAAKKRQEAIEAMTKIEIEFAQLRDKLFLEKMEEIARERWQIENGIHPEHAHLLQLVEHRRTAKLELARRILKEAESSHARLADADLRFGWSQWMHGRHDLVHTMVDDMNQKRRRLDREKRSIERPRNEELTTILRMHAPPPYMFYEKKHPLSYGRDYSIEYEVAENMQKKRKRGAVGLDHDEAIYDLERMGLRDPYRGSYPPPHHYDPALSVISSSTGAHRQQQQPRNAYESALPAGYGTYPHETAHPSQAGPSGTTYPGQAHLAAQHPGQGTYNNPLAAAQGRTVASVSQHGATGTGGRSDPFSAYRMQGAGNGIAGAAPSLAYTQRSSPYVQPARPPSGPRPTLDDHLGYSTMGHARTASNGPTGQTPATTGGHERQNSRSQQRYDFTIGGGKSAAEGGGASKFMPSYYAALGVQRT